MPTNDSTLQAVAITAAETTRTDITVYVGHTAIERITVFSEWPKDWNSALAAHGFGVEYPWIAGAPRWTPLWPYGASASTTADMRRR